MTASTAVRLRCPLLSSRLAWLLGLLPCAAQLACRADDDTCPACERPTRAGNVATLALDEASGVVASAQFDDVVYAHNDAGDSSRLFAMRLTGEDLGTFDIADAANDDWEDIARGPCEAGTCLYIGDIGDNDLVRTSYSIYIVREPQAVGPGEHMLTSERIEFSYDTPRDAEAMLVHPQTAAITIVTKASEGPAAIYELPLPLVADRLHTAVKVGELEPPEGSSRFTGGAIHPDGTGILLRTNARLFHFPMAPSQTAAEALAGAACALPIADETQGEALTWLDRDRILTLGEGVHADINIVDCRALNEGT